MDRASYRQKWDSSIKLKLQRDAHENEGIKCGRKGKTSHRGWCLPTRISRPPGFPVIATHQAQCELNWYFASTDHPGPLDERTRRLLKVINYPPSPIRQSTSTQIAHRRRRRDAVRAPRLSQLLGPLHLHNCSLHISENHFCNDFWLFLKPPITTIESRDSVLASTCPCLKSISRVEGTKKKISFRQQVSDCYVTSLQLI